MLSERTSVKDVIESCGVPHPEVDLILIDGGPVGLAHVVESDAEINAYSVRSRFTGFEQDRLQSMQCDKFIADGHLGQLARNLRLLGFDVVFERDPPDRLLVERAVTENRALLTRDRHLLMHRAVGAGYYPRSQDGLEQTLEVVRRFGLGSCLAPFTRCIRCNTTLERVSKPAVFEQLEPLTKIYYDDFRRCPGCEQVYWRGSHFDKLTARIEEIRARLSLNPWP